ncbi:P-loop containing nucleoside triphosphate hydrolase protein [Boletus edulis BED1]|uniref:P-loop containing nucleoside triphosphate hydrolase protein n=1 Tax=Boletus edulis BED1 TaxID=1328754 RepID=A0AAD4C517_BOLED|nr:P-loop containing nucleoside triphosphate hydrolase protein [Boletus edulis BED1]
MTVDSFLPTGLLGPKPIVSPPAFVSNGLLGDSSIPTLDTEPFTCISDAPHSQSVPHSSDNTSEDDAPSPGPLASSQDAFLSVSDILGLKSNFKENPESCTASRVLIHPRASLRATTFNGKLVFIPRKPRVMIPQKSSPMANLLDVPIHRLMDELSVSATSSTITPTSKPDASHRPLDDMLWVDQYRPQRFTELLGNERVAREVMAWVKQWDWCVFGKRRNKKRHREDDQNYDPEDEYHRPREKLLLISGPPGLGKTTLTHVIAAQAGYEAVEINASDTRSAQSVEDRVRPILESGSTIGSTKPVLLIVDEIDGATGGGDNSNGFVQKLVSLTFDKPKKKRNVGAQKDKRPLLRPIICICNDLNAHSLAKLRPHAHQIRYTRPADIHIVKRLREICALEGLDADTSALSTLVNVAKGDLRGCLNTLQFIKSRNEDVTEELIRRATVGMKETDVTATAVLNEIFAPLSRKRIRELAISDMEEARYVNRLSRAVEALNNHPNIANGCFAHYMNCHRHEANMTRYETANEWLGTFDIISSAMYADGDFGLQAYLPYLLVSFHPLCRERAGKRVERDSTDWDNLLIKRTNENILKSLYDGICASGRNTGANRHLIMGQVLQLEFAPYINRIISPHLRPVNSQIIKPAERALLARLVEITVSLELRFVQERAEDGQMVYRLDPPVDVFVTYDGRRAPDIAISRYAVRHLIATEIDASLVTRQTVAVENVRPVHKKTAAREFDNAEDKTVDAEEQGPLERTQSFASDPGPLSKRTRTEKHVDIADKPPVDFFGRPVTIPKAAPTSVSKAKHQMNRVFQTTYRYREGNSAAVRKAVKVASFI